MHTFFAVRSFRAFLTFPAALLIVFAAGRPATAQVSGGGGNTTSQKKSSDQVAEEIIADPNAENALSRSKRTLGVQVHEEVNGLAIVAVYKDTVAQHVGLQAGDHIVAIDGRAIQSPADLVGAIRKSPYQSAVLTIVRGGGVIRVPLNWTSGAVRRLTGVRGSNDEARVNGVGNGLRIVRVLAGSWAATSGLVENDRIISVNTTPVTTRAQLIALLVDAAGSDGIPQMLIERGGCPTRLELHLSQGTTGPGSLTDVSNIIGTMGDLASAMGNPVASSTGPGAVATGTAVPTEANRSPMGSANPSGGGTAPAPK